MHPNEDDAKKPEETSEHEAESSEEGGGIPPSREGDAVFKARKPEEIEEK